MALWTRKKVFGLSKGYYNRSKNCFRVALRRVFKALQYEYRDRRIRRREVRTDWIQAINAAVRDQDVNYSRFVYGLNRSNINLDRKILAEMARNEPYSLKAVLDEIKTQVPNMPNMPKKEKINYHQAVDKKMLVFGEFDSTPVKDIPFKYAYNFNKNNPDWYGLNEPNFPENYVERMRKFRKEQMPLHEMKKLRFTAWDDVPSEPDDE
jgi:large subunit ribosomal protein L20